MTAGKVSKARSGASEHSAPSSPPLSSAGNPLREEKRGGIAVLTLDRPAQRNSLSEGLITSLRQTVDQVSADAAVKAVVIASTGAAFSAGHDLKELTARRSDPDGGRAYYAYMMDICAALMLAIVRSPKPFIVSYWD